MSTIDVSTKPRRRSAWPDHLELAAIIHASVAVVFASWAFGGAIPWAHDTIGWWGLAGLALPIVALIRHDTRNQVPRSVLRWSVCFFLLAAFVAASCFNPSFEPRMFGTTLVFLERTNSASWPSNARPDLAWHELLMYAGCFFTGFNLALLVRRRRMVRLFLLVVALNALVLSIMGTAQYLLHRDLYFGLVKGPNEFWFATFVYHNHWGAFIILSLSAACALITHHLRRVDRARDFWHTPAFAGIVLLFFIAATLPLCGSRSSTALAFVLLTAVFGAWLWRFVKRKRAQGRRVGSTLAAVLVCLLVASAAIYHLGADTIQTRLTTTVHQWQEMRAEGGIGNRAALYRDTLRMAHERRWFGWGLESYGSVFSNYDSQESYRGLPPTHYEDAHSDWLQSLAEIGIIGTALLILTGALPLLSVLRHRVFPALTVPLWVGCFLLLLYACVEFPFANPAVTLVFWCMFFSATRYCLLSAREDPR
ncbi:O-antigen ligase family protein [Horticoccus luteus]|uniref:O-antigen ligase family protein n=1 Tax=Horticoccus luteus TaxID=2862869 RepID=A0A8F9TYB6_9BACT|nr:O-antigen ligase family protein [Horticoccus luteus]QYM80473.1 O-antigen ligase family protein [Horticoccus luteus]